MGTQADEAMRAMKLTNTTTEYGLLTRILHWCVALLMSVLIGLGWWMVSLSYYDPWYHDATQWHKALGMFVLFIASAKVLWSMLNHTVLLGANLKAWERVAARATHLLLLLLMVLIPSTGYVVSTSAGDGIMIFSWTEVPAMFAINTAVRDWAITIHYWSAYGLALFALLHAAAAIKHQFVDRDGTLRRMLW